jgi:hypothetical protein
MAKTDPRFAPLDMNISPQLYDEIRERWLEHVSPRRSYSCRSLKRSGTDTCASS